MNAPIDKMYKRLPVVHQMRDADNGEVLRGLLQVVQQQAQVVEDNINQLYQDAFIETCKPWVVPYIGELVGITRLASDTLPDEEYSEREAARQRLLFPRGEVARAVQHYRRKGTLSVLENLANLVGNWHARAVEFYEQINQMQSIRDPHPELGQTANLREVDALDRHNGPFDEIAHLPDVRSLKSTGLAGRYNPSHVGLLVWRLQSYPLHQTVPKCVCVHADDRQTRVTVYALNPQGHITQLFTKPEKEHSPTSIAREIHVPAPIRFLAFKDKESPNQASAYYYGEGKSVAVWMPGFPDSHSDGLIPRHNVIPMDLADFAVDCTCQGHDTKVRDDRKQELIDKLNKPETQNKIAVDPVHGLLAVHGGHRRIKVTFHYGFSANLGGGEYHRKIRYRKAPKSSKRLRVNDSTSFGGASGSLDSIVESILETVWTFESKSKDFGIDSTFNQNELSGFAPKNRSGTSRSGTIRINDMPIDIDVDEYGRWSTPLRDGAKLVDGEIIRIEIDDQEGKLRADFLVTQRKTIRRGQDHITIEISSSGVYELRQQTISLNRGQMLEIKSSNGRRPLVNLTHDACEAGMRIELAPGSELTIDGIVISQGRLGIGNWNGFSPAESGACECSDTNNDEELPSASVNIRDCTLDPKAGACGSSHGTTFDLPDGIVRIENSIVGTLVSVSSNTLQTRLSISDSIVESAGGSVAVAGKQVVLRSHRTTFFGTIDVGEINIIEDCIFTEEVRVTRTQVGGIRFSYVPPVSKTPPRYCCQPDLAREIAEQESKEEPVVEPKFTSRDYGNAAYAQLALDCPTAISQGAEDGSEMGAYHDLYQPQRATHLRQRIKEFTPVSLSTEVIYAN